MAVLIGLHGLVLPPADDLDRVFVHDRVFNGYAWHWQVENPPEQFPGFTHQRPSSRSLMQPSDAGVAQVG
ncbi:MAG: hypothetical protein O3B04_10205, partial [Chloroflexi bacterium]|nr:hypothetical protein [Chloroflexota bacterium]